jgi:transcription elongation factor GreB
VTVRAPDKTETTYRIVGVDETDVENNWVSWMSPIAKALLNRRRGERFASNFLREKRRLR